MPITTEKRTRKAKRGTALAIAGGALLVLLSLPLVQLDDVWLNAS